MSRHHVKELDDHDHSRRGADMKQLRSDLGRR